MAPLQKNPMCKSLETGVHTGTGYTDLDGHNKPGCPQEKHGYAGSFTHGTTIWAGGVPRECAPAAAATNPGTVLYTSSTLKPNLSEEPRMKEGADGERQGRSGSQPHWTHGAPDDSGAPPTPELNHGTVLFTSATLKPTMAYEGRTNVAGGRATERLGARGGFTAGVNVRTGGPARAELVRMAPELQHGTVLATCPHLRADMSYDDYGCKDGTDDTERRGRVGSFVHGDARVRLQLPSAESWAEAGQARGARRFGPGHYLAGTTIMAGVAPQYVRA